MISTFALIDASQLSLWYCFYRQILKLSDANDRIWNMRRVRKDLNNVNLKLEELKERHCTECALKGLINTVQVEVKSRV